MNYNKRTRIKIFWSYTGFLSKKINFSFGAGIRSPSTGIIFNNEMADFTTLKDAAKKGKMSMKKNLITPGNI